MKYKTIDDNGEEIEIEAFSQEEFDAKLAEKETELKTEFDSKLSSIEQEKKDLEAKVSGTKEDHPNFKALKEALDKKDGEIKDFKTTYENDKKQSRVDFEDTLIKSFTKGNEDFQKKIKYHLENTVSAMKDDSKELHQKKIEAAIKLASDNSSEQTIFDMGMSGGRGMEGASGSNEDKAEFSSKEKALGSKFGITDEDYKKYASRVSKK